MRVHRPWCAPCRIREGGVERHPEQRFAALAQLHALADAVPPRYRAMILTAGFGGLRQGELFALRRGDVDLEIGVIHVRRKRLRLASGQTIEGDPKSQAGRRTVALPAPAPSELTRHIAIHGMKGPDGLIFTGATGVALDRTNFRERVWMPAREKVGVDGLRFHDLRHTAGTFAAHTGRRPGN